MCKTRRFLNHITIFATVVTTGLIVVNMLSDQIDVSLSNRKINKLETKLDKTTPVC